MLLLMTNCMIIPNYYTHMDITKKYKILLVDDDVAVLRKNNWHTACTPKLYHSNSPGWQVCLWNSKVRNAGFNNNWLENAGNERNRGNWRAKAKWTDQKKSNHNFQRNYDKFKRFGHCPDCRCSGLDPETDCWSGTTGVSC